MVWIRNLIVGGATLVVACVGILGVAWLGAAALIELRGFGALLILLAVVFGASCWVWGSARGEAKGLRARLLERGAPALPAIAPNPAYDDGAAD